MPSLRQVEQRELNAQFIHSDDALIIAGTFAALSLVISFTHLIRHLRQYTMPQIQMWIIRIILICPAYAVCSTMAVALGSPKGEYVEFARDLYEAFVVYSLLNLIMEYCGGEADAVYAMENEPPLSMPFPLCCTRPKARDAKLLRFCQRGVLQFVVIKPVMATADVIMMASGNYYNVVFMWAEGIIYNFSYCTALYSLLVMYLATKTQLKRFRCVTKISAVKSIIVISYYQSLVIKLAPVSEEDQFLWKSFILALEMAIFASMLACAFPVSEFLAGIPNRRVLSNMKDLFAVRDLVEGFEHNFRPEYKDYALQRQQGEAASTDSDRLRTYFGGNANATAMEMTERYRGRSSRLQFNSLLRGDKPISAGLRGRGDGGSGYWRDEHSPGEGDGESRVKNPVYSTHYVDEEDDEVTLDFTTNTGKGEGKGKGKKGLESGPDYVDGEADGHRPPSHRMPAIQRIAPPRPVIRSDNGSPPEDDGSGSQNTPLTKIALRDGRGALEEEVPGEGRDRENPSPEGDSTSDDPAFESFHGANFASLDGALANLTEAAKAKGRDEYFDSPLASRHAGSDEDEEDEEEAAELELSEPILVKSADKDKDKDKDKGG